MTSEKQKTARSRQTDRQTDTSTIITTVTVIGPGTIDNTPSTGIDTECQFYNHSVAASYMTHEASRGVNGHITRCTSHVSVILWLRLVSGWGLRKRRSAPPHWSLEARERTLFFTFFTLRHVQFEQIYKQLLRVETTGCDNWQTKYC